MKRFISLTLTFLMLILSVNTIAFASGLTEKTFSAKDDIFNLVEGEGFHHNSSAQGRKGLEVDGTSVVLRQKEWICYDISDFESGIYEVILHRGSTSAVTTSVSIDDKEVLSGVSVTSSGSYSKHSEFLLGEVEFTGSQKKLKISNTTSNKAMYISEITVKKLDPLTMESFDANFVAASGAVAQGADSFVINMSAELDTDTATADSVYIADEDGNALKANVSASGKVITLDLKESLEYSKEYTLNIDGVKASNGQGLEEAVCESFETADDSVKKGETSIEVTSFESENGDMTASGFVKSSKGLGISGRYVSLSLKGEESDEFELVAEALSTEDGAFTISYIMPEDSDAGKYDVSIAAEYGKDDYVDSMLYFSKALDGELTEAFKNLADIDSVEEAINEYADYLGIDFEWAENIISDFQKVYDDIVGKPFENAEAVITALKQAVYFEALMQTENADDIVDILDDELKAEYIGDFNAILFDDLTDDRKAEIAEAALDYEATDADELAYILNEDVKAQLILQTGLSASEISFSSDEIMTGETAEIKVSLDEAIEDVCTVHIELAYSEKSAAFFGADGISVETKSGISSEVEFIDNVLFIDLKADGVTSLSGDFATIKIPASGKAGGEHEATATGYILYHPEEISDENESLMLDFITAENPKVKVDVVKSMSIKAPDVINRIEGDGFHNEPSLGGAAGLDVSGSAVIYRTGEWCVYDISSLAEGKYEFSINFSSNSGTTFVIECDGKMISQTYESTGGYGTYLPHVVGKMDLSGLQKTIKVTDNGPGSAYVGIISIERVDPLAISETTANTGIEDGNIARGTDRITMKFNNALNSEKVTDSNVIIKDNSGKVISAKASASGNSLFIDMKEALDYETEYTVSVNNIEDKYAQTFSGEITLVTDDESNTAGTSQIKIDNCKVNGKKLIVEGQILSSTGNGIKGREIKLSAKAPGASGYESWAEGMSKNDGEFILNYTFADDDISGKYNISIDYEYAKTPYKANVYYFDDTLSKSIADDFSNLANGDAVMNKLKEYEEDLGISLDIMQMEVNLKYIADAMAKKEFESAGDVIDEVNKRFVLEKVNQAFSDQSVYDLIDAEDGLKEIGDIQRDKWNTFTEEEKLELAKDLRAGGKIAEPDGLIEKINELINKKLEEKYELSAATVVVDSESVNVGQNVSLAFSADEKQENVVGIFIEIEYDEDEAALFENTWDYTLSKDLKNLSVKKTEEEGKITLELSVNQTSQTSVNKVTFRKDIITLGFKADEDSVGTYSPKISGYITYHVDEAEENQTAAYFVDIPFELSEEVQIKVSEAKQGGNKEYGGGGGASGGSGYATSGGSVGSSEKDIPSITDEGLKTEEVFTDLDSVSWAKDSIEALALKGVVNGRGDGTFAPNDSVTRAEFCKMITMAFGAVKNDATCEFADVPADAWYYTYIASAKDAGFVNGKTAETFAPNDTITREEMAAIALRALGAEKNNSSDKFADDGSISEYAKDGVYTLKNLGILDGVGDNMFAPKAFVTRAMAAKVIYALMIV